MYIVTFNIGDTDVSKDILNNSSENMSECEKKNAQYLVNLLFGLYFFLSVKVRS